MFNSMVDELKEVKYLKELTDCGAWLCKILYRNKMFEESSKSRGLFKKSNEHLRWSFFVSILNGLLFSK